MVARAKLWNGVGAGALVFATSILLGTSEGLHVLSSGTERAIDNQKVGGVSEDVSEPVT